ncbi:paraquat-inducible protein A [Psychrobium sp. 1_MG-2023]|uniref:paraquat-inducible protein A n=1 Tax=Psychrobium sp. 1_MG-2023 TaxID=3062624 RepID=UPI000C32AA43|nr:paraquat-inducible protein A [Psychrobium sp. 1_MG-2023]MDP2559803.1 paraquat-inducible protein A [Psychrobium sp. 1_MG-2023]PKF59090.1 hypothetical protein CW748_02570 [Alteromonadales bacterium alter-6D02]
MKRTWHVGLNFLWLGITIMLFIGITQPMFTFTHFYFFDDTFSLFNGIFHLLKQQELILFFLLFAFSIVMPSLKMLLLLYTINARSLFNIKQQRRLNKIALVGKWSMLDVYVIAMIAVTVKLGMIATVTIHSGLIIFTTAVVLSMILPLLISYAFIHNKSSDISQLKVINERSEHLQIKLTEPQLTELLSTNKLENLPREVILHADNLVDVFDHQHQWQAKGKVSVGQDQRCYLALYANRVD